MTNNVNLRKSPFQQLMLLSLIAPNVWAPKKILVLNIITDYVKSYNLFVI